MNDAQGQTLLGIARAAIAHELGLPADAPAADATEFAQPAATFVTLRLDGALRGCIGSLTPQRALAQDVAHNARAAAFRDPRFAPLTPAEFARIRVEVSRLTPPVPMSCVDEADALAQLRPDVDGIVISDGARQATFLPQVWESLPDPREFMAQLKRKAGMRADEWPPDMRVLRYTVEKFAEPDHA